MRQGRALEAASALRGRAVISFNNGHPGSALRLIERGFATIADSDVASDDPARRQLEIELWISRALVEAEVYGLERGLRCLAAAQESATGFAADGLVARIHSQAAAIAMRAGLWEKARDELGHAERLIDSADENDQFAILLNSGSLRLFRGELVGTRTALDRALQHARRAERSDWILKAAHNLGYTEFLAGNLPAALALMSEALTVDADVSRGVPLLDVLACWWRAASSGRPTKRWHMRRRSSRQSGRRRISAKPNSSAPGAHSPPGTCSWHDESRYAHEIGSGEEATKNGGGARNSSSPRPVSPRASRRDVLSSQSSGWRPNSVLPAFDSTRGRPAW